MKLVKLNGGHSIAVFQKNSKNKVKDLLLNNRVDFVSPANYSDDKTVSRGEGQMDIQENTEEYIKLEQAKEAYINVVILKNGLKNQYNVFYFLASMNLLNAYIKKDYADDEYKKRYLIKDYVSLALTQLIEQKILGVEVYIDKISVYIKVHGRQFSFHYVTGDKVIRAFQNSKYNVKQEWCGIRLQPICVSIYNEAKLVSKRQGSQNCSMGCACSTILRKGIISK